MTDIAPMLAFRHGSAAAALDRLFVSRQAAMLAGVGMRSPAQAMAICAALRAVAPFIHVPTNPETP